MSISIKSSRCYFLTNSVLVLETLIGNSLTVHGKRDCQENASISKVESYIKDLLPSIYLSFPEAKKKAILVFSCEMQTLFAQRLNQQNKPRMSMFRCILFLSICTQAFSLQLIFTCIANRKSLSLYLCALRSLALFVYLH